MNAVKKNIIIAVVAGVFIFSAFAAEIAPASGPKAPVSEKKVPAVGWNHEKNKPFRLEDTDCKKVEVTGLPQVIKSAVLSKFVAYSIEDAYQGIDGVYRLVLKSATSRRIAYYEEDGNYLKQEAVKGIQLVTLR